MKMSIGPQLKTYRVSRGVTQMELEVRANLSHGVISRIESDKINPRKETLIKIAKELELHNQEVANLFGIHFENF